MPFFVIQILESVIPQVVGMLIRAHEQREQTEMTQNKIAAYKTVSVALAKPEAVTVPKGP